MNFSIKNNFNQILISNISKYYNTKKYSNLETLDKNNISLFFKNKNTNNSIPNNSIPNNSKPINSNITNLKKHYNSVIPLVIYQTWYTKNLSPTLLSNIESLKNQNPEFEYFLFDDNECREFIKLHFSKKILDTYDSLIPGAYKADLWRYCVLYINGGFYLDVKLNCYNKFKLIELSENEHFVLDRINIEFFNTPNPIFNAFMVSKKNNPLFLLAINQIVQNVENNYYGYHSLYPTGPGLLSEIIFKNNLNINIDIHHHNHGNYLIYKNKNIISTTYSEYNSDRNKLFSIKNKTHYDDLWRKNNIYIQKYKKF